MIPLARRPKQKGEKNPSEGAGAGLVPHLPLLGKIVDSLARRKGLQPDEAEDFHSWMCLKLLDERSGALEGFKGECLWSTYLTVVVRNLFRDYRNAKWGKWRPSAAAKRKGPTALLLEKLLYRDGLSVDHAVETLRRNHGAAESAAELELLAAHLPERPPRSFEGESTLERVAAPERTEERLERKEASEAARRAEEIVTAALQALPAEDLLIVRMRWLDDHKVSTIAKILKLEQKPLYRRCDDLLKRLREDLELRGLKREQVRNLFAGAGVELRLAAEPRQTAPPGPSKPGEEEE